MAQFTFIVTNAETGGPIEGAACEIYSSCDIGEAEGLMGLTNAQGIAILTETTFPARAFVVSHPAYLRVVQCGMPGFAVPVALEPLVTPRYWVTVNAGVGGKVDWGEGPKLTGSFQLDYGSTLTIQAIPDQGAMFSHWLLNNVFLSSNVTETFTVTQTMSIAAVFGAETYNVLLGVVGSGLIDWGEGQKISGALEAAFGDIITIAAYPSTGYVLHHWDVDGSSHVASNPGMFQINGNTSINAVFETEGGEDPPPPPPPDGELFTRSKTAFKNWILRSEVWERDWKGVSATVTSGSPMPVSGKLRYNIVYEDGNFPTAAIRLRFNDKIILEPNIQKGVPYIGEADISGFILESNRVRIGLSSFYGFWQKVSFTVYVDFFYDQEPTEDPSAEPPSDDPDWTKYLPWIVAGGGALLLVATLAGKGKPAVVILRE